MTIVLEVNPDNEDDTPIEDAVRWSIEGSGSRAISTQLGERIVSITTEDQP